MRLILTIGLAFCTLLAFGQQGNVSNRLQQRFDAEPGSVQSVMILLEDQANIPALDAQLTERKASLEERAYAVITTLKNHATATQPALLSWLSQVPGVVPGSVRGYWIANAIFCEMEESALPALANRAEIAVIDWNAPLAMSSVEEVAPALPPVPNGKEPGLSAIKAPALWAMGYTGYGRTAFTNDTGVDPTHPALAYQYRGIYVDGEQAWYQWNSSNATPFDCGSHGTHVTGTILGLDRLTNDTIGVAFNGKWIGTPSLCGVGTEDNVAAFQWALNPDGNPGTIADMPDVINNSWYDPSIDDECNNVYVPVLNALEAAGVATIFSAGNEGPGVQTITPPHNINTNLINSFTVGALNGASVNLLIADFSSRGPSKCGGDSSLLIKPEVSAPGVSVRSCVPGPGYSQFNGTSMAAPHVSGAIMLLKEAFPYLTGNDLKFALYNTCTDLGDPGEDNDYGMGIINVEEAFYYLIDQGFVPVSPASSHNALLVSVENKLLYCESEAGSTIIFENAGSEVLQSLDVQYTLDGVSATYSWTGSLAPGERATAELPALSATPGEKELLIELLLPNGQPDERPLDNKFRTEVTVLAKAQLPAYVDAFLQSGVCENGQALLRSEYDGPGEATIQWYDAAEDGNLLGEGPVFLTPELGQTTTFYADASIRQKVGMPGKDEAGSSQLADFPEQEGLRFSATLPFVLKSFKAYVDEPGPRIIKLLDEEGNSIKTKTVIINETGEIRVSFGMAIPVGEDMQLVLDAGKPFYYNSTGASYPYVVEDIVTIERANTPGGAASLQRYYYFYDWEIEYAEICGRTAVEVPVQGSGNFPAAVFSVSTDTLQLSGGQASVQFSDQSTGAQSRQWDFGDGSTSQEPAPAHVYSEPGVYLATLTVVSADGCAASAVQPVTVLAEPSAIRDRSLSDNTLTLAPNPALDEVRVSWDGEAPARVLIWDISGRLAADYGLRVSGEALSLGGLQAGMHIVEVRGEAFRQMGLLVKE